MRSAGRNLQVEPAESLTAAGKLLAVLGAFDPEHPSLSLTEVAQHTGMAKTTCHRILGELSEWGALRRSSNGRFSIGIKLFELGSLVQERLRLRELAIAFMEDLLIATRQTIFLAVLQETELLCIEKISMHNKQAGPSHPSYVAARGPATTAALGKAILAFSPPEVVATVLRQGMPAATPHSITSPQVFLDALKEIRATGIAYDREERRLGLHCVAAPIFDREGLPIAAMSVSGPVSEFSIERFGPAVRASTLTLGRRFGHRATNSNES